MNELEEEFGNKKETNYKKWAFRFLIYLVIMQILTFYVSVKLLNVLINPEDLLKKLTMISIISKVILVVGICMTVMSIVKKEKENYQYYISIVGYCIFTILTLLPLVISYIK
ncbi:hypothetical protein [Tenacibaculum sp. M341]|uniref:hypothetical protein n=1 Tax=Tenacibaculum sp. M341 TaxID=2530339 RepID=UPI001053BC4A|nr:hypothetical protein [Tenacibaculum sp. M341]TCI85583.1 hypothetical protein EYW44_16625 [Tenacibaculum sp. M341]